MRSKIAYRFVAIILFLIAFIAAIATLMMTGTMGMGIFTKQLADYAFVPDTKFEKQAALAANIYDNPKMWFAYGAKGGAQSAVLWQPEGAPPITTPGQAAVFFIHPTSYIEKKLWNAPLDDESSQARARLFLRGMASPFAAAGEIWAPRYRQASIGAFLTEKPEGAQALDAAYQDILLAFDTFVAKVQKDRPIILAGHSQGALHLTHLLKDRVAGKPIAKRIVAAYVVGWPVSSVTDLGPMGMPACSAPDQSGCIMSWESFAEPAKYDDIVGLYDKTTGFNGEPRKDTPIVCTNPLTGGATPDAPMQANLGTLKPSDDLTSGALVPSAVPARCDARGFLLIGNPPDLGPYVLPGNNFHVYDYPLFWANVRADALTRVKAYLARPRR